MPTPKNHGDRTKAHRLRQAIANGQTLQPIDALWLADYDEGEKRGPKPAATKNFGRSRSGRKVSFELEEAAESEGSGSAARDAAVAALQAKEEGRRLDNLTVNALSILKEAVAVYKDMCLSMRERLEVLEATHVAMLEGVRDHFAARTEAEMALMQQQDQGDPAKDMLLMMMAKRMGVELPPSIAARVPNDPRRRRPPANGAPPKPTP